jgi:phage terminase large subunit
MTTKINLIAQQFQAFNFSTLYAATICGKRSGKTFVGALWAGKQITKYPKGVGLIAAPTYKILQQAALDTFFSQYPELRQFYNKQEGIINLPEGGRIYIRSTDEPNALEGITANWAWLDEAGQMKRDVWRIVRARVSTTNGQIFITTSPYTMNWLYDELYLPWKRGEDEDTSVFTWKTADNPVFRSENGQKFLLGERKRLRPEEYAREYEGEFTKLTGLVWDFPPEQILPDSEALEKIKLYPDKSICGVDFGFNNPAAQVVVIEKDSVFYVFDEWKESQKSTVEIIEQAKAFKMNYKTSIFFPDPAEPDRIAEMKKAGLNCELTSKEVKAGLTHVSSLIREKKLYISKRCVQLLDEINSYIYLEGKDTPHKENDHLCDALRYALMGHRPISPEKRQQLFRERLERRKDKQKSRYF